MTSTISRSAAILAAAQTLAAKILLAIPVDRAALTQAVARRLRSPVGVNYDGR